MAWKQRQQPNALINIQKKDYAKLSSCNSIEIGDTSNGASVVQWIE